MIRPSAELCAIVERWLNAYASGDKDTMTNLFHDDPALTYIGSAEGETWRGVGLPQALAAYMDDVPHFSWEAQDIHGYCMSHSGWVDIVATIATAARAQAVTFRSTFILTLDKGVWRIVHVHHSNAVPNVQSMGYEARGFDELLDAASDMELGDGITGLATIMFTDIADSTTIAEAVGDSRWSRMVKDHVAQTENLIRAHDGTLIKSLGDGTMSRFGSARSALSAAIALQKGMAEQTTEPHLRIRVGLHTGDLVARDGDVFGNVVNKAARVAAAAAPDEIRVSDATRIMVGSSPEFEFGAAVEIPLKGLEGLHRLSELQWSP